VVASVVQAGSTNDDVLVVYRADDVLYLSEVAGVHALGKHFEVRVYRDGIQARQQHVVDVDLTSVLQD